jgi:CheY-like chemotaxis protein
MENLLLSPRLLFIDDEPEKLSMICQILRETLEAEIVLASTVEEAISVLQQQEFELIIADVFLPAGDNLRQTMGPRARKCGDYMEHLGGLVILDELERMSASPKILAHTACTDFALLEVLGEHVVGRIPKPAPLELFLKEVSDALNPPTPWTL